MFWKELLEPKNRSGIKILDNVQRPRKSQLKAESSKPEVQNISFELSAFNFELICF